MGVFLVTALTDLVNRNALKSSPAHLHFARAHPFNRRWVKTGQEQRRKSRTVPSSESSLLQSFYTTTTTAGHELMV